MSNHSRFVDTNILVRYLTYDIPEQALAARAMLDTGNLLINCLIVLECTFALTRLYGYAKERVADALLELLGRENIDMADIPKDLALEALLSARDKPGLSFGDALIIASMGAAGVDEIYSFDRGLKAEGITVRREPA